jgi:hypothetical protein
MLDLADLLLLVLAIQCLYWLAGLLTDPRNKDWQRGCAGWTFRTWGGLVRTKGRHEQYHIMCNYCQAVSFASFDRW